MPVAQGAVGDISYRRSLPLERGEVVITFDDGPMPRRTPAVLDALAAECVKATFFVVGTMVTQNPALLRRIADEGHTVASHSWSHAYLNRVRSPQTHRDQINGGLRATSAVLGADHPALSPFFRFPGLGRTPALDRYVADKNLIAMSADIVGDDWHRIGPDEVLDRVMRRLDRRGRGIILLHDIHERTALMLPALLRRLRAGGYKVVHAVPEASDTQVALALSEPPKNQRMQIALARLDGDRMRSTPAVAVARVEAQDAQASVAATSLQPAPPSTPPAISAALLAETRAPLLRGALAALDASSQVGTGLSSGVSLPEQRRAAEPVRLPARSQPERSSAEPERSQLVRVAAAPAPIVPDPVIPPPASPTLNAPAVPASRVAGFVVLDTKTAARFAAITLRR